MRTDESLRPYGLELSSRLGGRHSNIAASLDITERGAFGIITDLVEAGYVDNGRRKAATATTSRRTSRCQKRRMGRTVGEVLALLVGVGATGGHPAGALRAVAGLRSEIARHVR